MKKVVDELTKNHKIDKESYSGIMPEVPGFIFCLVLSYEMYISKLHPECDKLWQRPLESFVDSDSVWFYNARVGEKKLSTFLSRISKAAGLSKIYTNHSIRTTGASILSKSMFGPSQVMAVTGHKSVQSLSVYQRISDDEKMMMGDSLTRNILPSLPDLNKPAILPRPASLHCAVRHQNKTLQEIQNVDLELTDINMNELFNDFEGQEITCTQSISVNKTSLQPASMFSNCSVTIHQLTINQK